MYRSGIYLFNPRNEEKEFLPQITKILSYEVPDLISIIQIYSENNQLRLLKTYSLDHFGHEEVQNQVKIQIEMWSNTPIEISYKLNFGHHSWDSNFTAYIDDSMKLVERPIYTTDVEIDTKNAIELNGYFTYPSVNGGMLKESFINDHSKHQNVTISWANSSPIGCTLSDFNEVRFMLFRNIANNDQKGLDEMLKDKRTSKVAFIFRL